MGKVLLEAAGIFSLSNYSWTLGLQIVYNMHCEIFWPRQLEFWACPHVFDQLDRFVGNAWFALTVFSLDGNFCSRQFFEVIQLVLDNWIADCLVSWWKILAWGSWNFELVQLVLGTWIADFFVRHAWYALWNVLPRQLEFWACPHVFDQLDCFVRHAWFALSVFSHDGKFFVYSVFWGYPSICWQFVCRLFRLVMENSCSSQLEFWACLTILGHLDCRLFC